MEYMKCPHCQRLIPGNAIECIHCGKLISDPDEQPKIALPEPSWLNSLLKIEEKILDHLTTSNHAEPNAKIGGDGSEKTGKTEEIVKIVLTETEEASNTRQIQPITSVPNATFLENISGALPPHQFIQAALSRVGSSDDNSKAHLSACVN